MFQDNLLYHPLLVQFEYWMLKVETDIVFVVSKTTYIPVES